MIFLLPKSKECFRFSLSTSKVPITACSVKTLSTAQSVQRNHTVRSIRQEPTYVVMQQPGRHNIISTGGDVSQIETLRSKAQYMSDYLHMSKYSRIYADMRYPY